MQGAPPPWDDTEPFTAEQPPSSVQVAGGFVPMNEGSFLTGTTQMAPGQIIMLQPPSGAPKIMGTLLIIYGVLQGLGLFSLLAEPVDPVTMEVIPYPTAAKLVDGLSSMIGLIGFIAAGVFLRGYEKRGVFVGLGAIGVQFILGLLSFQLGSPDGGLGSLLGDGAAFAVWAGISAFCSGFCALLVGIPMFVDNNGLN